MALLITSFLAGLFGGAAVLLAYIVFTQAKALDNLNAERKRWINKALVRDGQGIIFPTTETEPDPERKIAPPFQFRSPFQQGKVDLAEELKIQHQNPGAANLPMGLREKLQKDVEAAKAS